MSTPVGGLVLVASPIGNLGDLSPRAVETLRAADLVCCEDTRRTRVLLSAAGIPAAGRLRSLHAHNEPARIPELLSALAGGKTVAVVTDAGMPAISDPGARLVAAAARAGVQVRVVPGPSAVLAALVVSGLATDRFCVEGFLPRAGAARRRRLDALMSEPRTSVILESPQRLGATLGDLAARAPGRQLAVCRELTKLHEEVWRGTASAAAERFAQRQVRGEVVVVVAGAEDERAGAGEQEYDGSGPRSSATRRPAEREPTDATLSGAVAGALAAGLSVRDAADTAARALGVSRRRAYRAALAIRSGGRPAPARAPRAAEARGADRTPGNGHPG